MGTRLSALDAAFLHTEDRSNRMQLAGVLTFAGQAPSYPEFRAAVAAKLPQLPHFQQRLERGRGGLLRPSWTDDSEFDLDNHLRRVALPAPGGRQQMLQLINDLTAVPLDLQRPLWELALVEGMAGEEFGLALKVHHCMVDGLSIMQIFTTLFTADQAGNLQLHEAPPAPRSPTADPAPQQHVPALVRAALGLPQAANRLLRVASIAGAAPPTLFNTGESGPTRETEYTTVPLEVVLQIKKAFGTTVNNIVLAAVTGATRRYLLRHDALVDQVFAFVPVNVRAGGEPGFHGNQIGMTYPALPVGEADPAVRVAKVMASVEKCIRTRQAEDTSALMQLGGLAPDLLAAAANRLIQFDGGLFNLTVTNVPGPTVPIYFLGRKLLRIVGSTPLTKRHALTIAALSYNGELTFSVTVDPRRLPDGTDLITDISAELSVLTEAALLLTCPLTDPGSNT